MKGKRTRRCKREALGGKLLFLEGKTLKYSFAIIVRTISEGEVENLAGNILKDRVGMVRPSLSYTAGGCINWYNLSAKQFDNMCKEAEKYSF